MQELLVHSSTKTPERYTHVSNRTAELIYVTAFLNRVEFRKWASEVAWETEVWIADTPVHLIHFNGAKFLGAYKDE
ncbi:MAG: hypothetical protein HC880_06275 [Bacteroidia bacterium]|nr:hypothetical protein [Bacteroidia bacterium]